MHASNDIQEQKQTTTAQRPRLTTLQMDNMIVLILNKAAQRKIKTTTSTQNANTKYQIFAQQPRIDDVYFEEAISNGRDLADKPPAQQAG